MRTRIELACILLIALGAIALVHPVGDFPLDDDENTAIATYNFARHHRFEFAIDTTPPLRAQVLWEALWVSVLGESFNVLRASTIALSLLTLVIAHTILTIARVTPAVRFIATLAFFLNPIFFWATHTAMTEVPYVFASMLSLMCFLQAFRKSSYGWFAAGCAAVVASWWIRQGIINTVAPIVVLAVFRERATTKWRPMLIATVSLVAGYLVMAAVRRDLIVAVPSEAHYHYQMWFEESFRLPEIATTLSTYLFFNVQHTALFFLPLSLGAIAAMPHLRQRWQKVMLAIVGLAMTARMTQLIVCGHPLPYSGHGCEVSPGNIFTNLGLGPPTLPDTWSGARPLPVHLSFNGQLFLSYASIIVATFALTAVVVRVLPVLSNDIVAALAAVSVIAGTATLAMSQQCLDRYALDTAWAAVFLLAMTISWSATRVRVVVITALVVLALFDIGSVQEYFAWNTERWAAWRQLRAAGVPIKAIDGGAEAFLYYELSQAKTSRERRRMSFGTGKREYVIAFGAMPGYRVVERRPYTGWFGRHDGEIVVLRALTPRTE